MTKSKTEKPGQLTACPECGSAVIVVQPGEYEAVAFTQARLEQAIRGAFALGSESGLPAVGYPVITTRGVHPELDEYIEEWLRHPVEAAQERAVRGAM